MSGSNRDVSPIKCVVWDLDDTVWRGILAEGDALELHPAITDVLAELDRRGILLSVASRNDHDAAWAALKRFGLDHYFLHPQIGWGDKSESVQRIATELNLGLDAFAFVDDQPYERAEVAHHHPGVRCYDSAELAELPARAEFHPRFVTDESARRRELYRLDGVRREAEESNGEGSNAFNRSLGMTFRITRATVADLQRIEELTVRTNQLNATGRTYTYEELSGYLDSPAHLLLVAELEDKFGSYGKIGVALVEQNAEAWIIQLLLMSCRVMSRGVGTVLFHHLINEALRSGRSVQADLVDTGRNRQMVLTYRFAGLRKADPLPEGGHRWTYPSGEPKPYPDFIKLEVPDLATSRNGDKSLSG